MMLSGGNALAQFVVTNTNTSGAGSLAQAVTDANNSGAQATIQINPTAITVASPLAILNSVTLVTGGTSSQVTTPSNSGFPNLIGFINQAAQLTVGPGVSLSNDFITTVHLNTSGSAMTVNGSVI